MKLSNNILLAITVVTIGVYVAVFEGGLWGSSYTADSVRYMRMAENIKAGYFMNPNGLAGGEGWLRYRCCVDFEIGRVKAHA